MCPSHTSPPHYFHSLSVVFFWTSLFINRRIKHNHKQLMFPARLLYEIFRRWRKKRNAIDKKTTRETFWPSDILAFIRIVCNKTLTGFWPPSRLLCGYRRQKHHRSRFCKSDPKHPRARFLTRASFITTTYLQVSEFLGWERTFTGRN